MFFPWDPPKPGSLRFFAAEDGSLPTLPPRGGSGGADVGGAEVNSRSAGWGGDELELSGVEWGWVGGGVGLGLGGGVELELLVGGVGRRVLEKRVVIQVWGFGS